jgi:protein gp37
VEPGDRLRQGVAGLRALLRRGRRESVLGEAVSKGARIVTGHRTNEDERPRQFTDVMTHEDRLLEPLSWRKPARVFVNSMSDLFHEDVPDAFIDKVFAVMALAPQHTFQILTKRPERMRAYSIARVGPDDGALRRSAANA